ncbi:hypothetical protein ARMSODRAFT_972875 [Armillaria solidipes]|uniref:CCHC-type domain-containing protein n=1 Tax=Armillaria solidipes TaxID=1076256 RepID=A0A2H3CAA7_9AGAR|nr:hypothetical protein ARMSODRAFT_972875 [Armillaria solidipes]
MYEERQKKWVFDQTHRVSCDSRPPQKGQTTTATSHNKAGGATSSLSNKLMGSGPLWEPETGRWQPVRTMTYGGVGQPIDISMLMREDKCFRCHKKGHLSKDCPEKKDYKNIRLIHTAEQEKTESKVKKVKETAV